MRALNLLCLPNAGASATMYLRWRPRLPAWIKLVPVELPGRGRRLGCAGAEDFDALVDQLCREHAETMEQPYALFGHSMGALLAYGMARRQLAAGAPLPLMLFASGTAGPSRRDADRYAGSDDASLVAAMRRHGGTPDEVFDSPELMRMTLDILRADYRLCRSFIYREGTALPMPLEVLAGRHDDIGGERVLAWQREAGSAFALHWFNGGHFFIREQEDAVLQTLLRGLKYQFAASADTSRAAA
ncbi:thioesterase II family protein [Janthinobacterium agaricidamnosum]|uniref:Thioesterase domain protein n=1 Tax=Janthinobacterium agaricidamnosum NBRC 102515 = DSM 9628 TaxID=1349767 RepID=W0V433_9BURK|nr:alpha/beta fold hydrolase [Janthinobacterium agaricidamnosum]CDG82365.1 thioesterase domain protein [Janthinobacterium agaricidamnosum NBRC 102515 = DSM 9628]